MERITARFCVILGITACALSACGPKRESEAEKLLKKAAEKQKENLAQAPRWQAEASSTENMILIPGGPFKKGDNVMGGLPEQTVDVLAFLIDRYEVTNGQYRRFVDATGNITPSSWENGIYPEALARHPVVGVTYDDAQVYADWCGKRLLTALEWEKAARGTDFRRYPWGDTFTPGFCNSKEAGRDGPAPVDAFPEDRSPHGVIGLAGNVREWTSTWAPPSRDGGKRKVVKGGWWGAEAKWCTAANESHTRPEVEKNPTIGFRCAKDAPPDAAPGR
jgi:formylglycine-generating enzyme required for sulfatase activity